MRKILIIIGIVSFFACNNQATEEVVVEDSSIPLKEKYGADEYGMRKYVMAFLYRGPNQNLDSAKAAELQKLHLENISRLAEVGKLSLAGPFMDTGDLRGIYIFNVENIEEARKLTETDPAIQKGSLRMELKPWYGSAALVEANSIHNRFNSK